MAERDFSSTWVDSQIVMLGMGWAFQVGVIRDSDGTLKIRIAKGQLKDPTTVSQRQKFNIKRRKEWEQIKPLVDEYLAKLESGVFGAEASSAAEAGDE